MSRRSRLLVRAIASVVAIGVFVIGYYFGYAVGTGAKDSSLVAAMTAIGVVLVCLAAGGVAGFLVGANATLRMLGVKPPDRTS